MAAGGTGLGERGTVSYSEVSGIVSYLLSEWLKTLCTPVDGRPLSCKMQLICTGNDSLVSQSRRTHPCPGPEDIPKA